MVNIMTTMNFTTYTSMFVFKVNNEWLRCSRNSKFSCLYHYYTNVDKGRNKLNGEQKQRITIAQAVINFPSRRWININIRAPDKEKEGDVQGGNKDNVTKS